MSDDTKPPADDRKATAPEAVVGSEDLHATDLDLTEANAAGDAAPVRIGERRGMFGPTRGSDTTGYGGLRTPILFPGAAEKPYGSYFDELTTTLEQALGSTGDTAYGSAVERVVVDRGELTLHIRREALPTVARALRDDPALRFEICTGVSGVHFPGEAGRELHAVYHLLSITHNRRVRLEVTAPDDDPRIPSVVETWPAADWHERETWDMFGIVFEGHPSLTRILMPDDWPGHPQRKDYPLGGIPVEYKGGTVPPPDERRSYN
ncbi:NADH-quinone oxidoreductase subunit C [Knoellia sp. CPCC 206450]|uniref:NADH-quinone oxidoreductase subunit C n=1 Tax=Knoellia tibetensis TaxID=3404798 RepID=UPI003B42C889